MKTRACFNNFESTLSVIRPLDLGAKICSPLTILTDLSISVIKIYEKMVSSICQRLLDKQWKPYELEMVSDIGGIYSIGRTDPGQDPIARNQGHFEPANNYQRYIVLHSGTIKYQENSIWRRSRLDLQRRVFRTMTYTI